MTKQKIYHYACGSSHEYGKCPIDLVEQIAEERRARHEREAYEKDREADEQEITREKTYVRNEKLQETIYQKRNPSPMSYYLTEIKKLPKIPNLPSKQKYAKKYVFSAFLFCILMPIALLIFEAAALISFIIIGILLYVIGSIGAEYRTEINARSEVVNMHVSLKNYHIELQNWYDFSEKKNRNLTKNDKRSIYPEDWKIRRKYIEMRDGKGCYLCSDTRNNDRYYFLRPGDKRHMYRKGLDFSWNMQLHHIQPLSKGGDHSLQNLALLCNLCHEDQHMHLLTRRYKSIKQKTKSTKNPETKIFWGNRLADIESRINSLQNHIDSANHQFSLHTKN